MVGVLGPEVLHKRRRVSTGFVGLLTLRMGKFEKIAPSLFCSIYLYLVFDLASVVEDDESGLHDRCGHEEGILHVLLLELLQQGVICGVRKTSRDRGETAVSETTTQICFYGFNGGARRLELK